MPPVSRYWDWIYRFAVLLPVLALVPGVLLCQAALRLPDAGNPVATAPPAAAHWPAPLSLSEAPWEIVQSREGAAAGLEAGALSGRFRLAGTFFEFDTTTGDRRQAILDDLSAGTQRIVAENEALDGIRVTRIFRDRVVLQQGDREEELWLSFSGSGEARGGETGESGAAEDLVAGVDRFGGRRIGERRWVFNRRALLDYYAELRDEPERLVQVFDSLKPLYDERQRIRGYRLDVEGETEFFNAAGLKQGDIVRAVNSMAMTSRRRAEYFIREFVEDRANAFVLDVERNGTREKLIYQVR